MLPKIWFIKNTTHEAAGLLSSIAEKEKVPYACVDLHQGAGFPKVSQGQAVVILGGPDSANDLTSKITGELEAIRKCFAERIPMLGICLGMQLLVKAAGGTVFPHPVKEIGFRDPAGAWFEIERTEEGKKDPLFTGLPDACKVFQLHGETVGLTPSMVCLGRGRSCEHQIVKVRDRVYGIQGHVELNQNMFEDWLVADRDLRPMKAVELRRDFERVRPELEQSAEAIFKNFLRISGLLR